LIGGQWARGQRAPTTRTKTSLSRWASASRRRRLATKTRASLSRRALASGRQDQACNIQSRHTRLRPTLPRSGPTCVATCLSFRPRFAQNSQPKVTTRLWPWYLSRSNSLWYYHRLHSVSRCCSNLSNIKPIRPGPIWCYSVRLLQCSRSTVRDAAVPESDVQCHRPIPRIRTHLALFWDCYKASLLRRVSASGRRRVSISSAPIDR
jgi:hypothetical protein